MATKGEKAGRDMNEEQRTDFIRRLRTNADPREQALAQLMDDVQHLTKSMSDLTKAVIGQPDYGQWGLMHRVEDHHRRIKTLERMGIFVTAGLAVLALFWDEIKRRLFG